MIERYRLFATRFNTHECATAGASIFLPALILLANQSYAQTLVAQFLPKLNPALVPLAASLIVGAAGYFLYLARPHNIAQSKDEQS